MSPLSALTEPALDELVTCAAEITGFARSAILPDSVRRAAAPFLRTASPGSLVSRARSGDAEVARALCQAVSVGETFFFRQPEHFDYVSHAFVPERSKRGADRLRAWSAGCATGEETWSLAACLLEATAGTSVRQVSVLGTDLLARNVSAARMGVYGAWSKRETAPIPFGLFEPGLADKPPLRVHERLRPITRFAEHNLLAPPPEEGIDLIFCRNVLVYFAPAMARIALAHLASALAPGGVLVLGSMDAPESPAGMERTGPAGAQIWKNSGGSARALEVSPAPTPSASTAIQHASATPGFTMPSRFRTGPEAVALHLRALLLVEKGARTQAAVALAELVSAAPDYVPGLLERALWHAREGERNAAAALMREVLRRTDGLTSDTLLAAPEPLPVQFYRESAEAWLRAALSTAAGTGASS